MKLLQITNSLLSGGAEKLVLDTSIRFAEKGIQVDILLLSGSHTPLLQILQNHKNIKVFSLGDQEKIYNPIHIFKIQKYLKEYDLVHVHLFPAFYWTAFAKILSNSKTNLILTEHNTTNRRRKIWLFKYLDKLVYRQYQKIITISNAVDERLRTHLGESFNKIVKIYNGIDLGVINAAEPYDKRELGFDLEDKLIIQVSSFTPQKDQSTVIKALPMLPNNYKLLLVGDGPLLEDCKKLVKTLNLDDRVRFLGIRADVPRLLKSVDIVVLSSNYEGLSLSSVEGLASGRPFVSSDVPGLTEVVHNAGILFPVGDSKQLASCINRLLTDTKHFNSVTEQCLERAKDFDIEVMINSYIDLYKSI